MKLNKQLLLCVAATTIGITTTIVFTELSSNLVTVTPAFVVVQHQDNFAVSEQLITKAILENSQRNGENAPGVAPERVRKIAISEPYALAEVQVGEHGGGVAVLSKKQGEWKVIGGGGGWLVLNDLVKLGIPYSSAQILLERIDPNWRNYEPEGKT